MTEYSPIPIEAPEVQAIQKHIGLALWFDLYNSEPMWRAEKRPYPTIVEIFNNAVQRDVGDDSEWKNRVSVRSYDHETKSQEIMRRVESEVLSTIFSLERIEEVKKYVDFDSAQISEYGQTGVTSIKSLDRTKEYEKRKIRVSQNVVQSKAERFLNDLPESARNRVPKTMLIDTAYYSILSHEMSHPIEETVGLENPEESTFSKAKRIIPEQFDVTYSPRTDIWDQILHRELLARGVEDYATEKYIKENWGLTEEEYQEFYQNYFENEWEKAQIVRNLLKLIRSKEDETGRVYDYDGMSNMNTAVEYRVENTKWAYYQVPKLHYFLPYKERPYSIDFIRDLTA